MGTRIGDWIDQRSDWRRVWSRFMLQRVPRPTWSYALGAATLMSVAVLVITGVLLSVYYVPSPESAHASVAYITNELPFGWFVRGLHHWAASFLVVLAIAHMIRVIVHGAYKYPREFTWFSGVALLLLAFAFGLTGSLLPWDQRAFWATNVRMGIFGAVPLIGDWLVRFLQGGAELSGLTLSRFYSAHVLLFPVILAVLIGIHLRLVVKHGSSRRPRPGDRL